MASSIWLTRVRVRVLFTPPTMTKPSGTEIRKLKISLAGSTLKHSAVPLRLLTDCTVTYGLDSGSHPGAENLARRGFPGLRASHRVPIRSHRHTYRTVLGCFIYEFGRWTNTVREGGLSLLFCVW